MASVKFDHASRTYPGSVAPSLDRLDITVEDGELFVLLGPSGAGKSTALRMLAGLEEVSEGRIVIGDRDVTDLSSKERDVAMVFENYALYPHLTVADNMGLALRVAGTPPEEIRHLVEATATSLDLGIHLQSRPHHLTGWQRQRVAMGRALVRQPQVFVMDEPLANLDAALRVQTREQIVDLQRRLGVTAVYATSDPGEAIATGDRVAVLVDGVLQQCDAPRHILDQPATPAVAELVGSLSADLVTAREVASRPRGESPTAG